jgi:acetyl esterase/lipase
MKHLVLACICLALTPGMLRSQSAQQVASDHQFVPLWDHGAPGSHSGGAPESVRITPEGDHVLIHVDQPAIAVYLPSAATATGAAVLVVPGGGHSEIWIDHEGYNVARFLSSQGVAAFVLKYRLARETGSTYTVEGTELGDVQRALRTIRARSKEWSLDPKRVGIIGFSAGGELAALASTRADSGNADSADAIERESSQPDFQGLLYPAIPNDPRVTERTPMTFLACGAMDRPAISQGSAEYYLALARAHVPAELHIYAGIGHGFGIRTTNHKPVADWPELFIQWMGTQKLLAHP